MLPQTPQTPNSKRYWGEERNIDSIYSIYLKKISYTYNNDISLSATHANTSIDRRSSQDDSISSSSTTASNERSAIRNNNDNQPNLNINNCQKPEESPRGRRNFFLKYRRRSCSMDKYSLYKQQQQKNQFTPTTLKGKPNMKFLSASAKKSDKNNDIYNNHHDEIDGHQYVDSKTLSNSTQLDFGDSVNQQLSRGDLLRSMKDLSTAKPSPTQSLQWETRQIKVLQAATLDHALKFILLINPSKDFNNTGKSDQTMDASAVDLDGGLEEERNNVAHIIHVMFCTYRIYTNPHELMLKLMDYSDLCRIEQYRFVMHYWMDNYPEDFEYFPDIISGSNRDSSSTNTTSNNLTSTNPSTHSHNNSITSFDSANTTQTAATTDSENSVGFRTTLSDTQSGSGDHLTRRLSNLSLRTADERSQTPLVDELLRLCRDDYIKAKALKLREMKNHTSLLLSNGETSRKSRHHHNHTNGVSSKNSAILDLDSRYVAQQLTAIDLGNFLGLKPYSLLEGTKSDKKIQHMVKNFNLLSKHVVITILKSHSPSIVTSHWIAIAMNLRKIKNFNSLKAIIAGLTNESVYRLKQTVWAKIDRTTMTNFKQMASIVDDVNNQTVLRQTQLIVEGTAKMSIEDESFGTIPYLGTFLTDLNMIDARYPTYVPSPKDETSKLKLINFEKCAKQFEILTQVQLLQKNVLASLHAIQRRNHFDEQTTLNRLKLEFSQNQQILLAKPALPQVSKLFENWFYDHNVSTMTDKQCYEISVALESNVITR